MTGTIPLQIHVTGMTGSIPLQIHVTGMTGSIPLHIQVTGMTGSIPLHIHVTGMTGTIPLQTRSAGPRKRAVPEVVLIGKAEKGMLSLDPLAGPSTTADPFPGEVTRTLTENGT